MRKIQMVDLKSQYEGIKDEVSTSMQSVLESSAFINGPEVHAFQKELETYLGIQHVIPCANGTDALQIAMMALDLRPGDEVITVDFTFAATVEVIALLGLTPVLVDIEKDTFNICPKSVERAITPKTKAIVPVHLFGQTANMDAIQKLARENDLYVIEDNAQAIGATYTSPEGTRKKTGTLGHVAATSFFPSKNLGCYGDGGAIFTDDDDLAHKLRGIVNHGMYKRYHHDVIGVNSRLDSLQAAVLRAKLRRLDEYNARRRAAAVKYSKLLGKTSGCITPKIIYEIDGIPESSHSHVFHQYTLRILNEKRDSLIQHLNDNGVPCGVYYPIPLHQQKAYADSRYKETDFPVTNQLVKEVISLPMHTELDDEQIEFIAKLVLDHIKE
ncbi:MAG: DegT/DnrJ/EryC1/StrS family aminotransferase [Bacteroidota bacterium]